MNSNNNDYENDFQSHSNSNNKSSSITYKFKGGRFTDRDILPPINNKDIREIAELKVKQIEERKTLMERNKSMKNIYNSKMDKKVWK